MKQRCVLGGLYFRKSVSHLDLRRDQYFFRGEVVRREHGYPDRDRDATFGFLNLVPASALYYILVAGAYRDPVSLVGLVALIVVLSFPIWAVHTSYLVESFRTGIRSSGYGISYADAL
jgi:hypothetical protein